MEKKIYIIFNEDTDKIILKTENKVLALRYMLYDKSGRNLKLYMKKERS